MLMRRLTHQGLQERRPGKVYKVDNQTLSDQHFPSHRKYALTQIIKKLRDVKVPSGGMQ